MKKTQKSDQEKLRMRDSALRQKYGISLQDYELLCSTQADRCAICGEYTPKLVCDHQHGTCSLRGLLCSRCNIGLGSFGDCPDLLRAAADYLDRYEKGIVAQPTMARMDGGEPRDPLQITVPKHLL